MPKQKQLDKNYIAVMGKIFDVLNYLIDKGAKQEPVAFSAMVKALPFSRTTIHRILYSLEKLGYVEKAEVAAHYRLAAKFFEFSGPAIHFKHLQSISRSIMNDLMARHMENVNLGVLQNGQVIHLDVIQSPNALRVAAFPGERNPVHCTALGKAILAFLPESEVTTLLDGYSLVKKTPKTITQKAHLREHLALVREHGVAIDLEENLSGVTCLAAPIFDHAGRVVAALSVSGPTSRMNSKLSAIKNDLRTAALAATRMIAPLYETEHHSTDEKQPTRRSNSNNRKTTKASPSA
jgi:DNA-binding IclR family transcriptional regulator